MLDLLIKDGTVGDGTGAPGRRADVAIQGEKITDMGKVTESAQRMLDASDLIVTPGFPGFVFGMGQPPQPEVDCLFGRGEIPKEGVDHVPHTLEVWRTTARKSRARE